MRLRDLDGRFVYDAHAGGSRLSDQDSVEGMQGVMFQCPTCAVGKERGEEDGRRFVRGAHYVRVFFSNPRGAPVAPTKADDNPRWEMSGTTLDDLTLSPSINLDVPENTGGCRWHGFVRNGDAS
jgi:hypothetical protein